MQNLKEAAARGIATAQANNISRQALAEGADSRELVADQENILTEIVTEEEGADTIKKPRKVQPNRLQTNSTKKVGTR